MIKFLQGLFSKKQETRMVFKRSSFFSTDINVNGMSSKQVIEAANSRTFLRRPKDVKLASGAMDSAQQVTFDKKIETMDGMFSLQTGLTSDALTGWYASQGFIGYQMCAMISQHWLVKKACYMPAQDAIRNGFEVTVNDGTEIKPEVFDYIRKRDKEFNLNNHMKEFIGMGRTFGIRVAKFDVESDDKDYYKKPFNIDGVMPGKYKGIVQIDPYWLTPVLDMQASINPGAKHFYEPTYWRVSGGEEIHRSHLIIYRTEKVPDVLKPAYLYGGVSVPQKIYERVYAAERTANEAPLLTMTKRLVVQKTNIESALSNQKEFEQKVQLQSDMRDNYGTLFVGRDDSVEELDTNLAELDAVIMTQFQLVASIADVPATKLLGTSPKGFNATGEFEAEDYREFLETTQENDLMPFVDRHHLLLIKSDVAPKFKIEPFKTVVVWNPVDAPTEKEIAEVNNLKSQSDKNYFDTGAVSADDIRDKLISDESSGYSGLEPLLPADMPDEETTNATTIPQIT